MRLTAHRRLSPLCLEISPSPTDLHAEEMSAHSPSHDSIITLPILQVCPHWKFCFAVSRARTRSGHRLIRLDDLQALIVAVSAVGED
ncbi:hypothetical protein BO85DRAFT_446814 [Aspergillus piperis CBS 112811]|uniref:Uncharacterized protein n=1 Tax=Aspergillus piperis CBS 112811 TaxID=1448313 RepID=A0A8G1VNU2_9EURO|nr:hypothetical protein BO85DRAFT_446814 [Aspergillus piperis CBS 112811]RAH60274.1 hypothetical protein BO85DRAFT_446814 [Aspergillus piperis CBS 112811]